MTREICNLSITVVANDDESTTATGSVTFDGNGADVARVLAHIFDMLKLEPMEAFFLSTEAIKQMNAREGDEE